MGNDDTTQVVSQPNGVVDSSAQPSLKDQSDEQIQERLRVAQEKELKEQGNVTPVEQFTSDIERDLLFYIITNLKKRELSLEKSQELATDFLALLPVADKEELLKKLQPLSEKYSEAQSVYIKYASSHEEQERKDTLVEMTEHIKSGNIEEAIATAKEVTSND